MKLTVNYQWPSIYIQSEIFKNIEKTEWSYTNRNKLLQSSSSISAGNIYDAYVKSIFLKFPDDYLMIENCTKSETYQVSYPSKGIYFYKTQISHESNTLYLPFLKNQPSVDLVYPPYMIQITQSKDHRIKDEGIEVVKTIFHTVKDDDWKLCFIVPRVFKDIVKIPKKGMDRCVACIDYDEHVPQDMEM